MSDTETNPAATEAKSNGTVLIGNQFVKDLSFEAPAGPLGLGNLQEMPEISLDVDVGAGALREGVYEVTLAMKAEAKAEQQTLFLVELAYSGVFSVGEMPKDMIEPFLFIEAPRLLFPFARQIIATVTRDGGFPPLMLQPIDFPELYRRKRAGTVGTA
ncbi:MAG: protein-export chaperone SecB [Proteobacteria bacterium]|nr:protein-export chaperone SecB [Pseudomonadota bacterium]